MYVDTKIMAAMRCMKCLWESDFQWKARCQFIEAWKGHYPNDRLVALSMVWANMKFLGCRYPPKTEDLVKDLESKGPSISLPDKTKGKPKPLINNFKIYEREQEDDKTIYNPVIIINESAQKSKKTISFEDLGVTDKTAFTSFAVVIDGKLIATGEGQGKKEAKRNAAENALIILRARQPIVNYKTPSWEHESAPCLSKSDLVSKAYKKAASISDDNIGNQMLRKMGWSGIGGVGKDCQGRAEPVLATGTDGKLGFGCKKPTQGSDVKKSSVHETLKSFLSSTDQQIKFSTELTKEDRAVVHEISKRYGLKHRSFGKDKDRYIVVCKR